MTSLAFLRRGWVCSRGGGKPRARRRYASKPPGSVQSTTLVVGMEKLPADHDLIALTGQPFPNLRLRFVGASRDREKGTEVKTSVSSVHPSPKCDGEASLRHPNFGTKQLSLAPTDLFYQTRARFGIVPSPSRRCIERQCRRPGSKRSFGDSALTCDNQSESMPADRTRPYAKGSILTDALVRSLRLLLTVLAAIFDLTRAHISPLSAGEPEPKQAAPTLESRAHALDRRPQGQGRRRGQASGHGRVVRVSRHGRSCRRPA